jgi:uncharacterized protein (DUF2062 family)
MFMYFLPIIMIISAGVCFSVAKKKRANLPFWVFMGSIFGPFAIPFVFYSKPKPRKLVV